LKFLGFLYGEISTVTPSPCIGEGVSREMESGGRKISVSPRTGRRVVARKKQLHGGFGDGFINSVRKLQRREICTKSIRGFSITDAQERFRNIRLQVQFLKLNYAFLFFNFIFCFFGFLNFVCMIK
jgi:hypothetical protein